MPVRNYRVGFEEDLSNAGQAPPMYAANLTWPKCGAMDFSQGTLISANGSGGPGWSNSFDYPPGVPFIITWQPVETDTPFWDLSLLASGDATYVAQITATVQGLKNAGINVIGFRIMQESNGSWFQWSANYNKNHTTAADGTVYQQAWKASTFIAAFQRCATVARQFYPNAWIDWCVNVGNSGNSPSGAFSPSPYSTFLGGYPGDAYVDVISMDFYQTSGYQTWSAVANAPTINPSTMIAFASAHNKTVGVGEFATGIVFGYDGVTFLNQVGAWADATPNLSYVSWYDMGTGGNGGDTLWNNAYPQLRTQWNNQSFGTASFTTATVTATATATTTVTTTRTNTVTATQSSTATVTSTNTATAQGTSTVRIGTGSMTLVVPGPLFDPGVDPFTTQLTTDFGSGNVLAPVAAYSYTGTYTFFSGFQSSVITPSTWFFPLTNPIPVASRAPKHLDIFAPPSQWVIPKPVTTWFGHSNSTAPTYPAQPQHSQPFAPPAQFIIPTAPNSMWMPQTNPLVPLAMAPQHLSTFEPPIQFIVPVTPAFFASVANPTAPTYPAQPQHSQPFAPPSQFVVPIPPTAWWLPGPYPPPLLAIQPQHLSLFAPPAQFKIPAAPAFLVGMVVATPPPAQPRQPQHSQPFAPPAQFRVPITPTAYWLRQANPGPPLPRQPAHMAIAAPPAQFVVPKVPSSWWFQPTNPVPPRFRPPQYLPTVNGVSTAASTGTGTGTSTSTSSGPGHFPGGGGRHGGRGGRIIIPSPPDWNSPTYRGNVDAFCRAMTDWAQRSKGNIFNQSHGSANGVIATSPANGVLLNVLITGDQSWGSGSYTTSPAGAVSIVHGMSGVPSSASAVSGTPGYNVTIATPYNNQTLNCTVTLASTGALATNFALTISFTARV